MFTKANLKKSCKRWKQNSAYNFDQIIHNSSLYVRFVAL
jgi:hypothetical protein